MGNTSSPVSGATGGRVARQRGEPTWEVADLFPRQGDWSEEEYLSLETRRLVELSDGCLEVLPMPTVFHQLVVQFLFLRLQAHVAATHAGIVIFAPSPVRLWPGKMREPDVMYFRPGRITDPRQPPTGADLVMEVVSPGEENRERDLEIKRREYARAGIAEYWIVDPEERLITVLTLDGDEYRIRGSYPPGTAASSALLPGFEVSVDAALAAGNAV